MDETALPSISSSRAPAPLDAEVRRLEKAEMNISREFSALVSSYEEYAARAGQATVESSVAPLEGTIFLEELLRAARNSANSVLEGMTGMVGAVNGLEELLNDIRKISQNVSLVEQALLTAEKEINQAEGGKI